MGRRSLLLDPQAAPQPLALQEVWDGNHDQRCPQILGFIRSSLYNQTDTQCNSFFTRDLNYNAAGNISHNARNIKKTQGAQGAPRVVQPGPVLRPLDALGRVDHLLLLRHPHLPHRPSLGLQASQSWSFGERPMPVTSWKYLLFFTHLQHLLAFNLSL